MFQQGNTVIEKLVPGTRVGMRHQQKNWQRTGRQGVCSEGVSLHLDKPGSGSFSQPHDLYIPLYIYIYCK